ncbi:hypothetical protein KI387_009815, partial [Taxus chinensis]
GRPPFATVDFLVAGYRLGCIVPCTISIPRKSMRLMQVLKAELEESNIEKAKFEEAKTGKEELEESNMQKEVEESNIRKEELEGSNFQKANLFASRSERLYLPINTNSAGMTKSVSSFFSRPSGTKSILNISALQDFQYVGPNTYRCTLPKMVFLKFEVFPVLDLRVTTTCKECIVEMLSCRVNTLPFSLLPISAVERPGNV